MSSSNLAKRNKALAHLDSRRASSRGREDVKAPLLSAPRGKKEKTRDLTPKTQNELRRSSAPSPRLFIGSSEQRSPGARSPKPELLDDADEDDLKDSKDRKPPRRRDSRHYDPVLQPRTKSSPAIILKRQDSDGPLTYAQAAGSSSTGALQRTSITTTPVWAVQRQPPPPLPVAPRKKSADIALLKKTDSIDNDSDDTVSVFDQDDDFEDENSDFTTDISTASLEDLPPEIDRDDRLIKPQKYFKQLEELEVNVAGNSALFLMKSGMRQAYPHGKEYNLRFNFHGHGEHTSSPEFPDYDSIIMKFCKSSPGSSQRVKSSQDTTRSIKDNSDLAYWAFNLLECRNLILQVKCNIKSMKSAQYCRSSINLLSVSRFRPKVAKLVHIAIDEISQLHESFENALKEVAIIVEKSKSRYPAQIGDVLKDITRQCDNLLDRLNLPKGTSIAGRWRKAVLILDIGLVSYCGAHIERFDHHFLGEDLDLAKITAAWTYITDGSEGIMLRRRSLRCLDGFLGSHKVWVFQSQFLWEDNAPLYLSTTMEEFSDIWGPVWAIKKTEDSSTILKYDAGPGSIISWPTEATTPGLEENEVFCHWVALGEKEVKQPVALRQGMKLLIGAATEIEKKTSQLKENEACRNRSQRVIQQLRSANMLEDLGTRAESRELAQESISMSLGAYGMSLGGTKTYKRRSGITHKDAICDSWKHSDGNRNPAILEHWLGLEMSFCTHNARRRRLKSILNSTTMRNWLEACKINKEPFPCEKAFDEAIQSRDPRAFRDLYKNHREWRKDLAQLVSWCLEGLRQSSVEQDGTLKALWMPEDHQRFRVKLRQNPHTWTGFLADSERKCTMAIMSGKCLQTDYKYAACCQTKDPNASHLGFPVLETALVVNENASMPKGLELRYSGCEKHKQLPRWSFSRVPRGEKFILSSGRLRVIEPFARTRLLVEWEAGVFKKIHEVRQSMVRSVGKDPLHHWELKDEEDWPNKPIPIFILSQHRLKTSYREEGATPFSPGTSSVISGASRYTENGSKNRWSGETPPPTYSDTMENRNSRKIRKKDEENISAGLSGLGITMDT